MKNHFFWNRDGNAGASWFSKTREVIFNLRKGEMAKRKNKKKIDKIEIAGWCGAILFLASYAMVSLDILSVDSLIYQVMNLVGSVIAVALSAKHDVRQNVMVNVVWAIVSIIAIIRIIF